ncbi:MAG TPA: hypothetical protein VFK02_23490, partial [Kofleriaceae bacterium]|nr:hypothetical protein [Kofleriaceae bacterium]
MQRRLVSLLAVIAASRSAAAEPAGDATPDQPQPQLHEDPAPSASSSAPAAAPEPPPRDPRSAPLGALFRKRFQSSRLFAMPAADVVGAYVLSLSGEGSLLQKPGVLTSAGVLAIGFGDIAQLEYRHTEAIGVTGLNAPVPAAGVQLKIPIPDYPNVPAFGVAFRLGVPRGEVLDGKLVDETVTDLYLVGRLRLAAAPWLTLHGGARISSAKAVPAGTEPAAQRTLFL